MTAKQILDAFSETLMQDERILSPRERELLMNLLQNSRAVSSSSPETQSAVTAAIARTVGETVAQRAFALLGGSIVEQILATTSPIRTEESVTQTVRSTGIDAGPGPPSKGPGPPSKGPGPPSMLPKEQPAGPGPPSKGPGPPSGSPLEKPAGPGPPSKGPGPPSVGLRPFTVEARGQDQSRPDHPKGVGVLEVAPSVRAQCVVLDEFLAPQELDELVRYTLQHESDFRISEVVAPSGDADVIDYDHRRSRVLMDLGKHHDLIANRIRSVLPQVVQHLGMEEFPVAWVETQITASNDGDFFGMHSDNDQESIASRKLTFVYFFHGEPCQFKGGELRLHDAKLQEERYVSAGSYKTIVPQQNQIVFFACSLPHEITPVECPSRAFADSRFTLNGWLHE
jgi:Rps23 Pro-64 3,4-dihydroxylase Tpa1-like proline 4-hydroxylase